MLSFGDLTLPATIQRCNVISDMPTALAACAEFNNLIPISVIYISYYIKRDLESGINKLKR